LTKDGLTFDTEKPTIMCGFCRQSLYEAAQVSDNDIEPILRTLKKARYT
jgi:cytidine deaminase